MHDIGDNSVQLLTFVEWMLSSDIRCMTKLVGGCDVVMQPPLTACLFEVVCHV